MSGNATIRPQPVTLLLWALVVFAAIRFVLLSGHAATRHSDGFAAYYASARLLRSGADVERFYDDTWFAAQAAEFVPGVYEIYNVNPPTTSLLLLPLSAFDHPTARTIWTILNTLLLPITLALIVRQTGLRGRWVPAFLAFALLAQPVKANVEQGQVYVLLLCLLTLTWIGWRKARDALAGLSLGLALVLKTAGVLLPILLLIQRRWAALGWCAAVALGVAAVSLPWIGLDDWRRYLQLLLHLESQPELSVTAYQSLNSLLCHLFSFDSVWNPSPVASAPAFARLLSTLSSVMVIAISAWTTLRSKGNLDLSFAAFVSATVFLSPVSLDYHYTLLLLPIGIFAARLSQWTRLWSWPLALFGISDFLVAADLPYRSAEFASRYSALLAYPKLYGSLLLWALLLWESLRQDAVRQSARSTTLAGQDEMSDSQLVPTSRIVED